MERTPGTLIPYPPQLSAASQLLLRLATGHVGAAALNVVISLGVPELVRSEAKTVQEIAEAVGVEPQSLRRVLRALQCLGVFRETSLDTFGLTFAASQVLAGPMNLSPIAAWLSDPVHLRAFANLRASVKTGGSALSLTEGGTFFELIAREPLLAARFHDAMAEMTRQSIEPILAVWNLSGVTNIIDIGGGTGELLAALLRRHPSCRGILFDVESALAQPDDGLADVRHRFARASGDFMVGVPSGGDVYVLKHVLHDWSDEDATRILLNIRASIALGTGARVALIESVVDEVNWPTVGALMDLSMLALTGGRERNLSEYSVLLKTAGFAFARIVHTTSAISIIEAFPE